MAIGAVYATSTMGKSSRTPVGPEVVERLVQSTELPVVAIGGIGAENLPFLQTVDLTPSQRNVKRRIEDLIIS